MDNENKLIEIGDAMIKVIMENKDAPESAKFKAAMDSLKTVNSEIRQNRKLAESIKESEFKRECTKKELAHKIDNDNIELEHKIGLEEKESDHKIELENKEFGLKYDDTYAKLELSRREQEAKASEKEVDRKSEMKKLTLQGLIELLLLEGVFRGEAKGRIFSISKWGLGRKGRLD